MAHSEEESHWFRERAWRSLGAVAPNDETVVLALAAALESPSETIRTGAALGLVNARRHLDDALPVLNEAPRNHTRWIATWDIALSLRALGPAAAPAVPALEGLLDHEKLGVRSAAKASLFRIRPLR